MNGRASEAWLSFENGIGVLSGEPIICIVCDLSMPEAGVVDGLCKADGGAFVPRSQKCGVA